MTVVHQHFFQVEATSKWLKKSIRYHIYFSENNSKRKKYLNV